MISGARRLPQHHVTIRVPWHDTGWNGTVCASPRDNTSCLILKRVAEGKDDAAECNLAGRPLVELDPQDLPPCVDERGMILSPKSLLRKKTHPYTALSESTHGHILPTSIDFPAYAAACVPFAWMLREGAELKTADLRLGFEPDREPRLEWFKSDDETSTWVQEHDNQRVLLDTFFGALQPEESLCFFYAKRTPLSDVSGRVLVGVGRVTKIGEPAEYDYAKGSKGKMRSSFWERSVFHSLRPDCSDGFLLPYQEILARAETDASIRPEDYVAFAPDELFASYSFGSELLSHDGAIASLLALHTALGKIEKDFDGPWAVCKQWIDGELNRLWKARGPFPGIGSALNALGLERGTLIAYEVAKAQADSKREHTENPWELIDELVESPDVLPDGLGSELGKTWRKTWKKLPKERRALLELLSRFALSAEQAEYFYVSALREEVGVDVSDRQILENPYLLYELSRGWPDAVPFGVIDRGSFPDAVVTDRFPIPEPSRLEDAIDPRRCRAAMVHELERAAGWEGHTLLPQKWLIQRIRAADWQPEFPLSEDVLPVVEPALADVVHIVELADGSRGYQLGRFAETRDVIAAEVSRRTGPRAKLHKAKEDWAALVAKGIDEALPESGTEREEEERAREEKAEALETIFESRLSVLIGPAGTGKTTLLKTLCDMPQVKADGILLLAPTGKARVRLETATKQRGNGKTIAQFLNRLHRYIGDTGTYYLNPGATRVADYSTVIIDECSMLTEEQLGAVFDALTKVKRYVLVGDPRQLPPIGAGRPFVDIVRSLAPEDVETTFPRVGRAYAELTIHRRQKGEARDDLLLASWFAGGASDPSADAVWSRIEAGTSPHLSVIEWSQAADLEAKLLGALVEGLEKLTSDEDEVGFEETIGGRRFKDFPHAFFNNAYKDKPGAGRFAEHWQILSPIRASEVGVDALNRAIQARFRPAVRAKATASTGWKKVPKPFGTQQIVYGDKVINVVNRKHRNVWPKPETEPYVANGDIGIVVGQYKGAKSKIKGNPWKLEVEFATQEGFKYGYSPGEFGDEGTPPLELAYALTVHKSQGSEFGITFIVLPNPCWLLSRELLYTALTRHQDRIVLLHQGSVREMRRYSAEGFSEIARRLTNVFRKPSPVEVFVEDKKVFLEDHLIHRTENGQLVRSKSELVIADKLHGRNVDYVYEQQLTLDDGQVWYPDFTIEDDATGECFYWEHLGMLHVPRYRKRWEKKLTSYRDNGVLPRDDGGGDNGTLIVTRDDEGGGLDAAAIAKLIDEVFG